MMHVSVVKTLIPPLFSFGIFILCNRRLTIVNFLFNVLHILFFLIIHFGVTDLKVNILNDKIMNTFIHQNGRVTDRDKSYNRLKTDTSNTVGFKSINTISSSQSSYTRNSATYKSE